MPPDRRGTHLLTRRVGVVAALCLLLSLSIGAVAAARPPVPLSVPAPAEFQPFVLPGALPSPASEAGVAPAVTSGPIADFPGAPRLSFARPAPVQAAVPRVATVGWPRARLTGKHASGSATWYCQTGASACPSGYGGGMYAAAGPALRVGAWRGRLVRVCGGGNCIDVRLVDWCACGGGHIIDLFSDAFRRLAPLSSGALSVTVRW